MRIKKILNILQFMLPVVLLAGCDVRQYFEQETQSKKEQADLVTATDLSVVRRLHDTNCISCHDSAKYESGVRAVNDFPALLAQVERCNANLRPGLTDKEIVQVADYLNQTFYEYEKP